MKRRYKAGDWFRIRLGGPHDALGVITHACRSRLFGYFFAWDAAAPVRASDLRALAAQDAVLALLFGGRPLEDRRWEIVATSLALDARRWPLPEFAMRGAFGRSWSIATLDAQEMQLTAARPASAQEAATLPSARFASEDEVEDALRERLEGIPAHPAVVVCEVRAPLGETAFEPLLGGGRLQIGERLDERELRELAAATATLPHLELRVHGAYDPPFDLRTLAAFTHVEGLTIDAQPVCSVDALAALPQLEQLRLRTGAPADLRVLARLPKLHALTIASAHADATSIAGAPALRSLTISGAREFDLAALAPLRLAELRLAHVACDFGALPVLTALGRLEIFDAPLERFPDLSHLTSLARVTLRNVRLLRDLAPLAALPNLRELRIEEMPQLDVRDFAPLRACRALASLTVDVGSRTKTREVYRMLRAGRIAP